MRWEGGHVCGIAGVVCMAPTLDGAEAPLTVALASMRHRGPDADGRCSWVSQTDLGVLMGMTRLAVLDLTPAGLQPMSTPDGRFTIAYNGEITNYVEVRAELEARGVTFMSSGDTEVLLRAWEAWGPAARLRLEGMYAFAILDRRDSALTLCRDPFGIKPLYVADLGDDRMAFGSEIASVLPFFGTRPRLNWATAARYLASGAYDDSSATFIEGISHAAPGSMIRFDLVTGQRSVVDLDWWPSIRTDASLTPVQAAEGVRHRLTESVRRNLRSDVPVGLALSGGIDSTGISYLAKAVDPGFPIRTFSFVAAGTAADESPWIEQARHGLGGEWSGVTPESDDLLRDLDDVIVSQGEPFVSTSIYAQYRVFRLMHEAGIVVSLDGQGGDEVFAGYQGYPGQRLRSLTETGHLVQAANFLGHWSRWPGRSRSKAVARSGFELLPGPIADAVYDRLMKTSHVGVERDRLRARGGEWTADRPTASNDGLRGVRVKAELRATLLQRGLQSLLRHGDRNSMRWSVESRVPYLDRDLVTFVLSMPEKYLIDPAGTTKAVLRAALRGVVPDEILVRRDKVGFEAPDSVWLDGHRQYLAGLVLDATPIGFLDSGAVSRSIAGDSSAKQIDSAFAWRLVNLYRWAALLNVACE